MPAALSRCESFANPSDALDVFGSVPVSLYPQLEFSMRDVIRAGEALKGLIVWVPERKDEIFEIFRIANSWASSHAFPMDRMRAQLHGRMSALSLKGLTAARLKQMRSIRAKLGRADFNGNLRQLQDLGGCRAVVPTIDDARALIGSIKQGFDHKLKREDRYMDEARPSGYRSHHLVFAFKPRNADEASFEGRRIELQIRSRLQHSWATAVEAVGLYIGDNLKGSEGDSRWLRLFELMSIELARCEGCDLAEDGKALRIAEIIDLSARLDAIQTLDTLSIAVSDLDRRVRDPNFRPQFCLITYDRVERSVSVRYLNDPTEIASSYGSIAHDDEASGAKRITAVVVQVDKIENLKQAYPNYFGDVQLFKSNLSEIVHGRDVKQYSLPPLERVPPPPKEIADDSWLRQPNRRRWH